MDRRQQAIEELKQQIKLGRERLGPEGVQQLEKLAKGLNRPKVSPALPPGTVPYDKKSALAVFQLFLKNHGDPVEFERRLRELLNKSSN